MMAGGTELTKDGCILRQEVCVSAGEGEAAWGARDPSCNWSSLPHSPYVRPDYAPCLRGRASSPEQHHSPSGLCPDLPTRQGPPFPWSASCPSPCSHAQCLLLQLLRGLAEAPTAGQHHENGVLAKSEGFGLRPSDWHDAWYTVGIQ